jgi:signal peptidase II
VISSRAKWWLVIPIAVFVVILDQLSKAWVLRNISPNVIWAPIPALSKLFWLTNVTNTGAAFGLFRGGNTVLMVVAIVVMIAIIVYTHFLSAERWLVLVSLGLQLGGALGNFVSRARLGHVVDFLRVPYWPTFNVADSSIVVGVVLLALLVLTEKREHPAQESAVEG